MTDPEDIFETATIKSDGAIREAGPKGEPVEVFKVDTAQGSFWFEVYYDFAENGNDFRVTVGNFGLRDAVSAGSTTPLMRRSFKAAEAKAAQSRLEALFSGPRDNPNLPFLPFRGGKGKFLGLSFRRGWITIK